MECKKKIVIDTDGGVDDAFGLVLALQHPDWEVLGITCVSGNVTIDQVCINIGKILELVKKPHIPFYKGASRPIISEHILPDWDGHGTDGLGDAYFVETSLKPQSENAYSALIRLFKENVDCHLVCLGPLTNVAITLLIDPGFAQLVKLDHFTVMGGGHYCRGNFSLAGEFNVRQDPEAAEICLSRFPMTRMLTWETCEDHPIDKEWFKRVVACGKGKLSKFLHQISAKCIPSEDVPIIYCDSVAVALLLDPKIILSSKRLRCYVELAGNHSRGATVFDWYGKLATAHNVELIEKIDIERFQTLCENLLCAIDPNEIT